MHSSRVRLRSYVEAAEWGEPGVYKVFLHCRRTLNVAGVNDHYPLEAVLCQEAGNLFARSLEDGIVGMHPVQVVV